jgi:hypothetical protein
MKSISSQIKLLFIAGILVVSVTGLTRTSAQSAKPVPAVLEVPFAPIPVKAMDKMNLAYELHITNFSRTNLVLTGVEVLADEAKKTCSQVIETRSCSGVL